MKYPFDRIWTPAKDPQAPLKWRKSYTVRVNLSGEEPDDHLNRFFAVMALTPKQTYQVVASNLKAMAEYMTKPRHSHPADVDQVNMSNTENNVYIEADLGNYTTTETMRKTRLSVIDNWIWPLPNVMLGARFTTKAEADAKIPAAKWFVVVEPTEAISLRKWLWTRCTAGCNEVGMTNEPGFPGGCQCSVCRFGGQPYPGLVESHAIHFIELRGSTGPDARPVHPQWVRQIRDECKEAGVDFWFSGWGKWGPYGMGKGQSIGSKKRTVLDASGDAMINVGTVRSGRLLDGIEHNAGIE
jgi:hypothetical protein